MCMDDIRIGRKSLPVELHHVVAGGAGWVQLLPRNDSRISLLVGCGVEPAWYRLSASTPTGTDGGVYLSHDGEGLPALSLDIRTHGAIVCLPLWTMAPGLADNNPSTLEAILHER